MVGLVNSARRLTGTMTRTSASATEQHTTTANTSHQ